MAAEKRDKCNTKEIIFMVAAEMFAKKGYANVSMRDIAASVGIRSPSIYSHYPSKEAIMEDLLDHYLERMESFYQRLADAPIEITERSDLGTALNALMLAYEPREMTLMYQLTRIVHHEQFSFSKAAEALIGTGYKQYVAAHIRFFDRLSDAGFILGKEDNRYYGEMYARLSLTFGTQFLHPEIEPTIPDQTELSDFVNKLVLGYEEKKSCLEP